jgi:hypothetical protein
MTPASDLRCISAGRPELRSGGVAKSAVLGSFRPEFWALELLLHTLAELFG